MTDHREPNRVSFGQGAELMQKLIREGLTSDGAQRGIDNAALASRVVNMLNGVTAWEKVVSIMGGQAIGPEVFRKMGVVIGESLRSAFGLVPFDEEELQELARQGYFLVAIPGGVDLRDVFRNSNYAIDDTDVYRDEQFINQRTRSGFLAIRELPEAIGRPWVEQVKMCPVGYQTVRSIETAMWITALLMQGRKDEAPSWVRASDVSSKGSRVTIRVGKYPSRSDIMEISRIYSDGPVGQLGIVFGQFRLLR